MVGWLGRDRYVPWEWGGEKKNLLELCLGFNLFIGLPHAVHIHKVRQRNLDGRGE